MSIYGRIVKMMGLSSDNQGKYGTLYLWLSMLDGYETANPTPDVETNPWAELLRRLSAYSTCPAYKELAQEIGTRVEYDGRPTW